MILPVLLWSLFIIAYPLIYNIVLSLYNVRYGAESASFVGISNYLNMLTDSRFVNSFINSVIWTSGNLLLMTVVGLGGALLLNQKHRGITYIRNLIILPWVIPTIVATLVWRWMLEPDLGIINNILHWLGLLGGKPIVYLGDPSLAMLTLMLINTWKLSPFAIIIILAALQTIPKDLYEAAMIDGATGLTLFRKITMPLISPILVFLGFIGFVWSFNAFDIIWLTTEGGPGTATETLPLLIFRKAFREYRISQAASIATLMLMICLVFIILFLKRRE